MPGILPGIYLHAGIPDAGFADGRGQAARSQPGPGTPADSLSGLPVRPHCGYPGLLRSGPGVQRGSLAARASA